MFSSIINRTLLDPKCVAFFEWYGEQFLLRWTVALLLGGVFYYLGGRENYYHIGFPFLIDIYLVDAYGSRTMGPTHEIMLRTEMKNGENSDCYKIGFVCINYFIVFLILLTFVLDAMGIF